MTTLDYSPVEPSRKDPKRADPGSRGPGECHRPYRLYFNTTALARRLEREWEAAFKPFDLSPPQGFLLRAILATPGVPQRELAAALAIARPTATRALDQLSEKGYVERRASAGDGREVMIFPTNKASAIEARLNDASGRVTHRLKRSLGPEVFEETVAKIRGVRAALK